MRPSRRWLAVVLLSMAPSLAGAQGLTGTDLAGATFSRVAGPAAKHAVLDVGPPGSWSDQALAAPSVVFDGTVYRMWFTGVEKDRPGESPYLFRTFIGAATSPDGLHWTVLNGGEPVFTHGASGAFDQHSVGHPMVLRDRDRYLMWYGGADGTDPANDIRIERMGLAESADGITWTRLHGGAPVVDIGPAGTPDAIQATGASVVRVNGEYWMWYGAYNGTHTIVAARSIDGVHWTKLPVSGLGSGQVLGPSVAHAGGAFYMLYSTLVDHRWQMVAATSIDGLEWTPVNGGALLLPPAPAGNFDAAGEGQNAGVHPSQLLIEGHRIRVWYAGEDPESPYHQRIGLLEATVPHGLARADFNADGKPDLLWQDRADGYLGIWTMDGVRMLSSEALQPERLPVTRWHIVGTGDANGDGKPDIFWQDQVEGWLAVWLMNGRTLISSELMSPSRVADVNWKIVAIADMNGDNRPDLVWRERTEGWIGVWLMDGLVATQSLALSPERVADPGWVIAGVGDVNYDGRQDLVWQHRGAGWLAAWFMDGLSMTDSVLLTPSAVTDTRWKVAAVTDSNGDGKADLLWREEASGWLASWHLHGLTLVDSVGLSPERVAFLNWTIVGPR